MLILLGNRIQNKLKPIDLIIKIFFDKVLILISKKKI